MIKFLSIVKIDECLSNPCVNGNCTDMVAGYTCHCDVLFTGLHCDVRVDVCESLPCQNNGNCMLGDFGYECDCTRTGFDGSNCEIVLNKCYSNPCQNNGMCVDEVNAYSCDCTGTGFEGALCERCAACDDSGKVYHNFKL